MKAVLRYNTADDSHQWWYPSGDGEQRGSGTLDSAAKALAGRRVQVVLPAADCLHTRVDLPIKQLSRARQAAPNVLEEQFSQDIESLHFALARSGGIYDVAVCDRNLMARVHQSLSDSGMQVATVVGEAQALPEPQEGEHLCVLLSDEGACLRSESEALFCQLDELPVFLAQMRRQVDTDALEVALFDAAGTPFDWPDFIHLQRSERVDPLALMATAGDRAVNLLQGPFVIKTGGGEHWRRWQMPGALAVLTLCAWLIGAFYQTWQYQSENRALESEIIELYQSIAPGAQVGLGTVRLQMENKLDSLDQGGGPESDFLKRLNRLAGALQNREMISGLRELQYREGQLDLELVADDLESVEKLRQALSGDNGETEILSAPSEDGQVRAQLRMQ
ncbi:MAG: type II secretion system protein GspL [Pseudomonadota bacterium]